MEKVFSNNRSKFFSYSVLLIIILVLRIINFISQITVENRVVIIGVILLVGSVVITRHLLLTKKRDDEKPTNDEFNSHMLYDNSSISDSNMNLTKFLGLLKENNKLLKNFNNFKNNQKQPHETIIENKKPIRAVPVAFIKKKEKSFLSDINEVIDDNYDNPMFDVQQLADKLYMSRSQLYRKFNPKSKITIAQYLRRYRLNKAKELLENTEYNISQIMYKTGFINLASFSRAFKIEFGKSPKLFKMELDKSYV